MNLEWSKLLGTWLRLCSPLDFSQLSSSILQSDTLNADDFLILNSSFTRSIFLAICQMPPRYSEQQLSLPQSLHLPFSLLVYCITLYLIIQIRNLGFILDDSFIIHAVPQFGKPFSNFQFAWLTNPLRYREEVFSLSSFSFYIVLLQLLCCF